MSPEELAAARKERLAKLPPKHPCPTCKTPHWTPAERRAMAKLWDNCDECGARVYDDYMLKDEVWKLTGLRFGPGGGVLHLPCVEKRIGRSLTIDDFAPYSVNDALRWALTRKIR